jgi:hypothetical protein
MLRCNLVLSVVFPSKSKVHQNTKDKSEHWIYGQHDDEKNRTRMTRKVVANPMSEGQSQNTSCNKAEKLEQSPTCSPTILGNM